MNSINESLLNKDNKYRIRVLTLVFPGNDNYGAYLQGWALCRALNKFSSLDVKCFRYYEFDFQFARLSLPYICCVKNRIKSQQVKNIVDYIKVVIKEGVWRVINWYKGVGDIEKIRRLRRFEEFGKTFQDYGNPICWTNEDLSLADVDAYMVGSDWVWNIDLKYPRYGYFGFVNTTKMFYSYAASFGVNPNTVDKLRFVKKMAKNFKNLSIRESEGVNILHRLGFSEAHNDVDPTLLLQSSDWNSAIEFPEKSYNLVVYCLPSPNMDEFLNYISEFRTKYPEYSMVILNPNRINLKGGDHRWDIGPQDFLGYIKTANYIITNSFHACVFCAMFNKQFTVFPRYSDDTRIQNFLQLAGLESRMKINNKIFNEDEPIDWENVHCKIERQRRKSLVYLNEILNEHLAK